MFKDLDALCDGWLKLTIFLALFALLGLWKLAELLYWVYVNVAVIIN